jgi:hypothetical protein
MVQEDPEEEEEGKVRDSKSEPSHFENSQSNSFLLLTSWLLLLL